MPSCTQPQGGALFGDLLLCPVLLSFSTYLCIIELARANAVHTAAVGAGVTALRHEEIAQDCKKLFNTHVHRPRPSCMANFEYITRAA